VLASLLTTSDSRGDLIADSDLAALAIEHGLAIGSADTDFARFREVRWINSIAAG
jgi:predicted nucleic acid-binding protein